MANVAPTLERRLTPSQVRLLKIAGEAAQRVDASVFLVGGTVRDLLLDVTPIDIDLSFVGPPTAIVEVIAPALDASVVSRSEFDTFKLEAGGDVVDLAMARAETYPQPGALPVVTLGSIEHDLARRDFSINSMAVGLAPSAWGQLLDSFHGQRDITEGVVRVLHRDSFIDDATRILRGLRYARRLEFRFDVETEALVRRDLQHLDTISGDRMRHELERIFRESRAASVLEMAQRLGVLQAVYPSLDLSEVALAGLTRVKVEQTVENDLLFAASLAYGVPTSLLAGLIARLNMSSRWAKVVRDTGKLRDASDLLGASSLSASRLYGALHDIAPAAIKVRSLGSQDPVLIDRLNRFESELRGTTTLLDGDDLIALGVEEGPQVGELLKALLVARLDGELDTLADERAYVTRLSKSSSS